MGTSNQEMVHRLALWLPPEDVGLGDVCGMPEPAAEKLAVDKVRPPGLKPALILRLYAALKRRSSTELRPVFPQHWSAALPRR